MMETNKIEKSLIVSEKENILIRFVKWIAKLFGKKEQRELDNTTNQLEITIPESVKMPERIEENRENSLAYLYQLSDEGLDRLENVYEMQIEETKSEIEKLENILQTYRESIKKLQEQVTEEDI